MSKDLTIPLRKLVVGEGALGRLGGKEMPAALSFVLSNVYRRADEILSSKREVHRELLKRYEMPKNETNAELFATFQAEYEALMDTRVTLVGVKKLKASALLKAGVGIPPADAHALAWLFFDDIPKEVTSEFDAPEEAEIEVETSEPEEQKTASE